ncbi:sensor histidine kinase [Paenibacillus sp. FSL P2-0089]|uniref:sensor histidine kinase n=1 Tax=unclassified Paenibacillus TaxID=185978 RepID=UPI0030FAA24E
MSIVRKMIVGYIFLIFIPVVTFGYYYYSKIYDSVSSQFVESRQKILEQAYANMKADLARIDSTQRMLQYNPYVTDYLDGSYETDSESIYAYNRYINPVILQSLNISPEIDTFRIYITKQGVLPITDRLLELSALDEQGAEATRMLRPGQGKWIIPDPEVEAPPLVFYQKIYNNDFTEIVGLLELRVGSELIRKFYRATGGGDWTALLLPAEGGPLEREGIPEAVDDATWRRLTSGEAQTYFINREVIVNQLYMKELGVRVAVIGKVSEVFRSIRSQELVMITTFAVLLALLSFAYYTLASTITKRVLRLARHMRNLNDDNLKQSISKEDKPGRRDEISFLTETYNSMLLRMDELINNVHRAELRNKEAAYKVLQAQIKPHFLYNTLETIRMLAESNNDKEVAEISYWFGKLMRYSLSAQDDHTVLSQELETVVFYLNIHKMRLQKRLTYEVDIAVAAKTLICPRFILQPLVENSIIHGAAVTLRPVHILIQAQETAEEIRISVSDSGIGIPENQVRLIQARLSRGEEVKTQEEAEGGVGLYNVSERIKSFYGGTSRLVLESEEGKGTCLTIILSKGAAEQA